MSELDQWCEIDGHQWNVLWMESGFVLGPKTTTIIRWCSFCKTSDAPVVTVYESPPRRIIYPLFP